MTYTDPSYELFQNYRQQKVSVQADMRRYFLHMRGVNTLPLIAMHVSFLSVKSWQPFSLLTLSQTTSFRLFQTQRICRRQF